MRLLLEDVTLLKANEVVAHIRFRGGAAHTLRLPLPVAAPELRKTALAVASEIDRLLDHHTEAEIVAILNARGLRPDVPDHFSALIVWHIRQKYGQAARGQLVSHVYNDKGQRLYAPPGEPVLIACLHCGAPMTERGKDG